MFFVANFKHSNQLLTEKVEIKMKKGSNQAQNSKNPKPKSQSKLPIRKKVHPKKIVLEEKVPPSETEEEIKTMTFNMSTLFTIGVFSDITINMSEPFSSANPKDYNKLFFQKVKECRKICDFSLKIKDQPAKKNKKELLHHFIECFENKEISHLIIPQNISAFLNMVVDNISRPFPSLLKITSLQVADFGDQMVDTAWPHLQLVYKATFRLFTSTIPMNNFFVPATEKEKQSNQNKHKSINDHYNLLSCLVTNSCSPDNRERQAAKDILIKIYNKCHDAIPVLKRFVLNQFLTGVCSAELLEFYTKMVDDLPHPLSEKEIFFYKEVFLVLHTSPLFMKFCLNILTAIDHYVKIDQNLLEPAVQFLKDHWPVGSVKKQLVFLSELEGLIISYSNIMNEKTAQLIFEILSSLVVQPNVEIAETSLSLFMGSSCENLLASYLEIAMKIMVAPLYDSAKKNWNEYVREDATFAIQMLSELDKDLFTKQVDVMKEERKKKKTYSEIWKTNWAKVFETAKMKDKAITGSNLEIIL
ncbi:hypothetical protein M9Y10_013104 [Tritrichomonas musculus]|uniref:Phosphoprotein phosphatase n=1 Tax=Tritrichomonas musculus TaxID=1915356 RepID=A0ABR2I645_9EUKA